MKVHEEKKPENTTPSVQPKRSKISTILGILAVSAIIVAGIIRFYSDFSKIDPPLPKFPDSDKEFTNSLGMKFVRIPAGMFMMGSPKDEPGRRDDETQRLRAENFRY